jgi:hypothetical protein
MRVHEQAITRRRFVGQGAATAAGLWIAGRSFEQAAGGEPASDVLPVAGIATEYRKNSHADVILGKILEGFEQTGGPGPGLKLVSLYTDQVPSTDMSRALAEKHGFRITSTIEEAVTLGSGKVAVAGVLSIGEHGDYPFTPDTRQHLYPRRRFFDAITAAFDKHGKVVPVFNDKHLECAWSDALHMVESARKRGIPFLAGSSLPVAWRRPPLELQKGCRLREAVALGYSDFEAYGFHALETLQCMVEMREGGETGVASVQAVRGKAIFEAEKAGRWSRDLLTAALAKVPGVKPGPIEDSLGNDAVIFLIEYRDGLKAAVAMTNGLAAEFGFAGRIDGQAEPAATWFQLQDGVPFGHFGYLVRAIEHTIRENRPAYPVERTLLTTGILDAVMHSLAADGARIETPHLDVKYEGVAWPFAPGIPDPPRSAT